MLNTYSKVLDRLEKVIGSISIILLFFGFSVIFAQTVARYFFHSGAAWMEESGRYAIIYLSFLCSPIAIRRGKHMAIDVLESRFAPLPRTLLHLVFDVLLLWFFGIMTVSGVLYAKANLQSLSVGIGISMAYIYASCAIGFGLMLLFQIESLGKNLAALKNINSKKEGEF